MGDPFVGTIIDDRYEIINKIAEGGMGSVYFAKNKRLDVSAAIKILHPDLARSKKFLSRFENEAKTVVRLRHTNIVQVFDIGSIRDTFYIAMEFIEGEDLVDIIGRRRRLSLEEAMPIAVQVAQGLAYAHDRGILHRDIKPANIIIEPSGRAVITDFGIARATKGKSDTTVGAVVGTPEYMSLEQLKGMDLDERADIYSLGIVLYEMLSGISPFRSEESVQTIAKVISEEITPVKKLVPHLPPWAQQLVADATAKNRNDRIASARDFIAAVKQNMDDASFVVPEVVSVKRARPRKTTMLTNAVSSVIEQIPREKRALTAVLLSLILVGMIVTGVLFIKSMSFSIKSLFSSKTEPLGSSRIASKEWAFKTTGPIEASPLVEGGIVYFGNDDNALYAVETKKGVQKWVYEAADDIATTPVISGKNLYFGCDDHRLYALSTKDGELLWEFETEGKVRSSPTIAAKLVIFGSNDDYVYAVDKATGEEVWRFETEGNVEASPTVSDKTVYIGSLDNTFYALDVSEGTEVWRFEAGGDIRSSAVTTRKFVFFGCDDDYLYCLDRATGQQIWRFETGGDIITQPAVEKTNVYFGSRDDRLYAVNLETGELVWSFETRGDIRSMMSFGKQSILFGSDDHTVYAVDLTDGTEQWRFVTGDKVRSGPIQSGGLAFFGSRDGFLYAVR